MTKKLVLAAFVLHLCVWLMAMGLEFKDFLDGSYIASPFYMLSMAYWQYCVTRVYLAYRRGESKPWEKFW